MSGDRCRGEVRGIVWLETYLTAKVKVSHYLQHRNISLRNALCLPVSCRSAILCRSNRTYCKTLATLLGYMQFSDSD